MMKEGKHQLVLTLDRSTPYNRLGEGRDRRGSKGSYKVEECIIRRRVRTEVRSRQEIHKETRVINKLVCGNALTVITLEVFRGVAFMSIWKVFRNCGSS